MSHPFSCTLLMAICLTGCNRPSPKTDTIRTGMSYEKAKSVFREAGAVEVDVETGLGFDGGPADQPEFEPSWWSLPDKTFIHIRAYGQSKRDLTVYTITVGPKGKVNGGKDQWLKGSREV